MSYYTPPNGTYGVAVLASPANPAAGAALVVAVPSGRIWRPRSLCFALTTSATVANRTARVTARDAGGFLYARAVQVNVQAAGAAAAVFFQLGDTTAPASALAYIAGLFDVLMLGGHDLEITAFNLQAGDTITDARLHYEEWLV